MVERATNAQQTAQSDRLVVGALKHYVHPKEGRRIVLSVSDDASHCTSGSLTGNELSLQQTR